jgi:flavin reductase (DIM6/NTAB) family NADH-FMN oxidoreductase RutF
MPAEFRSMQPLDIRENVFELMAEDWMLVTAGDMAKWNTMTASWGAMGELWKKKVCFAFVRPQRCTRGFMDSSRRFTLSFFPEEWRKALEFCGSHSGRDVDKAAATGLTPFEPAPGTVAFAEARLVFVARKIYTHDLDPSRFLDRDIADCYPSSDYHRMYIGEVEAVLSR